MSTAGSLKKIALLRVEEAKILQAKRCYSGAYYLCGYSIECALKVCIAKKTRKNEFPDLEIVKKSYSHDLGDLIKVAGLTQKLDQNLKKNTNFASNWALVLQWNTEARYKKHLKKEAKDLLNAITDPTHGILLWIQQYW